MNTPNEPTYPNAFDEHLDAFGEPRTIPGGWDLSSLYMSSSNESANSEADASETIQTQDDYSSSHHPVEDQSVWYPEKFSKPSAPPNRWDMTNLL